jgi:basic amino acid/polyamine antiporter, APA family
MKILKRNLGLLEVTFSGLGIILGAGIYALIGQAASTSGNALWLSFLIASLVASFTALSYAELSSMYPRSSAEYEYVKNALGEKIAFTIGWLIIFSGILSASAVSVGFANYLGTLFNLPHIYASIALIIILSLVLFIGIKESAWVAIVFTALEAFGILIIVYVGLPFIGSVNYMELTPLGWEGIFASAALIFFAYLGFEDIVKLSDETKEPSKIIPQGLILAMVISTVLYVLVAISSVSVLGWEVLSSSAAPFSDIAFSGLGANGSLILSFIALFATSNTVLLSLLASSRIVYGMASSNSLPDILGRVHSTTQTPWVSILVVGLASIGFLLVGGLNFLANVTVYTLFVSFIFINASVIILRFTAPDTVRPFKLPLNWGRLPLLPLLGLITCSVLLLGLDYYAILLGIIITVLGLLVSFLLKTK